jgi:hypothetical protein
MESVHPELANDVESWASKQESFGETPTALPTDPTSRQIKYLRSVGAELPSGATRKDVSRLISGEATSGQIRRLKFYGIYRDGLSKDEASDLIESYKAAHPESEAAYQSVRGELIGSESFLEPNHSFLQSKRKVSLQRLRERRPSSFNYSGLFFFLLIVALAIIKIIASYRK